MTGTHRGRFWGLRPTGQRIETPVIAMSHVRDGVVTEQWLEWDRRRLLEQLGVVPVLT
jgi:predicted ester cyclase